LKIFKNGTERNFRSLSGGQKCSVNLAVDSAIAKMLSERSSKVFNYLFLDESLNGLDSNSKMEAISAIKFLFPDKLVMLVEHSLEINEALNGEILIKNTEGKSNFVSA
jgi:DNA repair exonuclease SbcCD ATPase subunit